MENRRFPERRGFDVCNIFDGRCDLDARDLCGVRCCFGARAVFGVRRGFSFPAEPATYFIASTGGTSPASFAGFRLLRKLVNSANPPASRKIQTLTGVT